MDELIFKEKMINSISDFRLPRYDEIVNVGLYLEQVVKYINFYLSPLGKVEITASMVSNYVKQKLVDAPVRKQYYTEHIARLIFIAILKLVVSLDDIRLMFSVQKTGYDFKAAYDYFCAQFESVMRIAFGTGDEAEIAKDEDSDAHALLNTAINTVVNKIYLEKYISAFREMTAQA